MFVCSTVLATTAVVVNDGVAEGADGVVDAGGDCGDEDDDDDDDDDGDDVCGCDEPSSCCCWCSAAVGS